MRFNDRIMFVHKSESYYDPVLGEYVQSEPEEVIKPCNLSSMGLTRTAQLFGTVDVNITIARLQRPYTGEFEAVKVKQASGKYKPFYVKQESNYKKGVLMLEGDNFDN